MNEAVNKEIMGLLKKEYYKLESYIKLNPYWEGRFSVLKELRLAFEWPFPHELEHRSSVTKVSNDV